MRRHEHTLALYAGKCHARCLESILTLLVLCEAVHFARGLEPVAECHTVEGGLSLRRQFAPKSIFYSHIPSMNFSNRSHGCSIRFWITPLRQGRSYVQGGKKWRHVRAPTNSQYCSGELYVVVELCDNGNLKEYLLKHNNKFIDELKKSDEPEDGYLRPDRGIRKQYAVSFCGLLFCQFFFI